MARTITKIKAANAAAGQYFFEPDTMRFFRSRVEGGVIGDRYFITSEKSGFEDSTPRRFSIRVALDSGAVETVGEFGAYLSRATAADALKDARRAGVSIAGEGPADHYVRETWLGDLRIGPANTLEACERIARELA